MTRPTSTGSFSASAAKTCARVASCGSDEGNVFGLRQQPGHAEKLDGARELRRAPADSKNALARSSAAKPRVIVRRIHVEKAQTFGIEAADFVLVDLTGPNFIEEINRPQFAALELAFEQRQHAAAVHRVQRLKALLPDRAPRRRDPRSVQTKCAISDAVEESDIARSDEARLLRAPLSGRNRFRPTGP